MLKVVQLLINQIQIVNKEALNDEDNYADLDQPPAMSTLHSARDVSMQRTDSMRDIEMEENGEEMAIENTDTQLMATEPADDEEIDYSTLKHTIYDRQQIIDSIFKIFNSKEFCDKIESSLNELVANQTNNSSTAFSLSPGASARESSNPINEFCLSISHICDFILIKSQSKIHESL